MPELVGPAVGADQPSSPQDVARTVVFLCSGANGNITGENVTVAGGR